VLATTAPLQVQPDGRPPFAVGPPLLQRPGDASSDGKQRRVDGSHAAGQVAEPGVGPLQVRNARPQIFNDGLQQGGIKYLVGVGECRAGDAVDRSLLTHRRRLAEVFEGAKAADGGRKKGQQIGDGDIVEKESAVGMSVCRPQPGQVSLEGANVLAAEQFLHLYRRTRLGSRLASGRRLNLTRHRLVHARQLTEDD
jgi:hypothetical protein